MQPSKPIAIGLCIAFVLAAAFGWYLTTSEFNPNPPQTAVGESCTASYCGRFGVVDANLTVINASQEDILSQYVGMGVVPSGNLSIKQVEVLLNNVSLGYQNGPFLPNKVTFIELGVPTSILITGGQSYTLLVGGVYQGVPRSTTGVVWVRIDVVASG